MDDKEIDYDALKKRGFLKQKQDGYFLLRTRTTEGNYSADQFEILVEVARRFGRDIIHPTTRQGIEIPFILFGDIDEVERIVLKAEIAIGTSGPRLRSTTVCPGNNWCKTGLVDTFGLFKRIETELGIRCSYDLPHKFKITISGCSNRCTRAESSEIGIHGAVDTTHPEKRIGYIVYIGGCGGRTPHFGMKLEKVFTEDEVLGIIERTVAFFKKNAKPRQRLALLIEEVGKEKFLEEIKIPKKDNT